MFKARIRTMKRPILNQFSAVVTDVTDGSTASRIDDRQPAITLTLCGPLDSRQVGLLLGLSTDRVDQIERLALRKLRRIGGLELLADEA